VDWTGKKERARIATLRDPREDEEWFRNLPDDMRADASRHWREKQEHHLDLQLRARAGIVKGMVRFGLLFALTDALAAACSTASHCFNQFIVGALTGLAVVLLDAGRLMASTLGTAAFAITLIETRGGLIGQHIFIWFFVATVSCWLGMQQEEHF